MTTATPKAGGHKAGRLHDNAGSAASLASRWVAKLVGLGLVVATITLRGSALPRVLLHYLYALGLYFFVGFLMDGPGAVAVEALGLQLVPTFDAPWLSTSLADFWGRRWNITTSSVLRTLVYDPLAEGRLVATRHEAPGEPAEVHRQQQPHHRHHHHHQQQQQHTAAMLETTLRAHGEAPEPACTGLLAASSLIALGPPSSVSGRPSEAVGGHDDSDAHASAHASESGSFASSSHSGRSSLSESGSGDCDPRHPDAGTTHRSSEMAPDEPAPAREAPHHGAKPQPPPSEPCEASNPGALAASTSTAATGGVWAPGSLLRRTLAVHACCLASGLCHEYAIWHVSGKSWHWKWTLFFYMQAPLMTLEGFGRRWLRRRGLRVPRLLANALTLAVLEATAYPLFFGFVETDTDLAKRVVAAVSHNYQEMLQPLRPLLASAAAALAGGGSAGAEP
ncbi:hypothetical protein HYH02_011362 [Chlamydomonas schloesseri]|nr:hypothetical protein HYH02_011362 [Chlamydomonas schloesseri]|eukprot:KAG2437104.1 hypothetical protein HYH02_011362 [Chlamydomonas schloesseri]